MGTEDDDLGMDASAMWRWLRGRAHEGPVGAQPGPATACSCSIDADGTLTIGLAPDVTFALQDLFPPAPWGPSAVRVGMSMVLPAATALPLLRRAARDLQVDVATEPAGLGSGDVSRLVRVIVHRRHAPEAAAFGARVTLLTMERPRAEVGFDFAFTEATGSEGSINGWLHFRGPKGRKSRAAALHILAAFFTPDEEGAPMVAG